MSSDRRFEYDKGPRLEPEPPTDESDDEDASDSASSDDRSNRDGGRAVLAIAPWTGGAVAGASAFAVVLAATYQLVGALDAIGMYGVEDDRPSRLVVAGLTDLANHGATIEIGGEPIQSGFSFPLTSGIATHVSALIPAVVLLVSGFVLVRYVALETARDAGLAVGSLVASYAVPTVVLGAVVEWTPENEEMDTIAVATDLGMVLTVLGTTITFAVLGAALAALPQLLEAAPVETTVRTD